VNVDTRRALIAQTGTTENGRAVFGTPKTGKSRTVPLHGFLIDALKPLMVDQPDDAYLFRAPRGGSLNPNNWRSRVWTKALDGTDFKKRDITPHSLRHTAASMAISAGADVKVVQTILGHASATETLNTHGHLWPDKLDEVTDAVGGEAHSGTKSGWILTSSAVFRYPDSILTRSDTTKPRTTLLPRGSGAKCRANRIRTCDPLQVFAFIMSLPTVSENSRIPLCLQGTERFAATNCTSSFWVIQ
jgi:hypothetical protein